MACARAAGLSRQPVALIYESGWRGQDCDAVNQHQIDERRYRLCGHNSSLAISKCRSSGSRFDGTGGPAKASFTCS